MEIRHRRFLQEFLTPLEGRGYPQLYDMRDKREQYSVASLHPDIVRGMQARITRAEAEYAPFRKAGAVPLSKQGKARRSHVPEQWRDRD